jgi:hypothetical protein
VEQYSRTRRNEEYRVLQELYVQHLDLALDWDRAIAVHGYAGAFVRQRGQP